MRKTPQRDATKLLDTCCGETQQMKTDQRIHMPLTCRIKGWILMKSLKWMKRCYPLSSSELIKGQNPKGVESKRSMGEPKMSQLIAEFQRPPITIHAPRVVTPPRWTFDPTRKSVEQTINEREKINKPLLQHVIQPGETVPINYWYEVSTLTTCFRCSSVLSLIPVNY